MHIITHKIWILYLRIRASLFVSPSDPSFPVFFCIISQDRMEGEIDDETDYNENAHVYDDSMLDPSSRWPTLNDFSQITCVVSWLLFFWVIFRRVLYGHLKAVVDRKIERSMETCGLIPLNARTWTWSWHRKKAGAHPYRGQNPWPPDTYTCKRTRVHPYGTHANRGFAKDYPPPCVAPQFPLWDREASDIRMSDLN